MDGNSEQNVAVFFARPIFGVRGFRDVKYGHFSTICHHMIRGFDGPEAAFIDHQKVR